MRGSNESKLGKFLLKRIVVLLALFITLIILLVHEGRLLLLLGLAGGALAGFLKFSLLETFFAGVIKLGVEKGQNQKAQSTDEANTVVVTEVAEKLHAEASDASMKNTAEAVTVTVGKPAVEKSADMSADKAIEKAAKVSARSKAFVSGAGNTIKGVFALGGVLLVVFAILDKNLFLGFAGGLLLIPVIIMLNGISEALGITRNDFAR
ncbi:MAG: hypothetical protein Q7J78_00150 [Clostridiales bacterium]|nr:hypothetical protein [Clostridiales bacterium]